MPPRTASRRRARAEQENPLASLAGGEASSKIEKAVDEEAKKTPGGDARGITAAMARRASEVTGMTIQRVPVGEIASHPFNDPDRSVPHPGDPDWDELLASVKSTGVKVPCLLVPRAAFLDRRPGLASDIGDAKYVLVYGDRRKTAAAEAGKPDVPAVIDASVMEDDGDLDALVIENRGRKRQSELTEGHLFARYAEGGLSQRGIAGRLGVPQSVVSRRLALLLLAPELQEAVRTEEITGKDAAVLAGVLPYGPPRPWQKQPDPGQEDDRRREEQLAALALARSGMSLRDAGDRVVREREARARAASEGVEIVDPQKVIGDEYLEHRLYDQADVEQAAGLGELVAGIDETGGLAYFATSRPAKQKQEQQAPAGDPGEDAEASARMSATSARRRACADLVRAVPGKDALLPVLIEQVVHGIAGLSASSAGWALVQRWCQAAGTGIPEAGDPEELRAAVERETDARRQTEIAWACAVASYEIHAASKTRKTWGKPDITYLDLLARHAGYEPSAWEAERLAGARQALRSSAAR